ncbi:MAG: DUF1254 domain-containing protein [Caulobacteraceae bacterium]|nr:DUF1254 domain-containing protein [Caulobacteraceae bacterium]
MGGLRAAILAALALGACAAASPLALAGPALAARAPLTEAPLTEAQAYDIGREAYAYLFPLVVMDVTRRVQTTVAAPGLAPKAAPMNVLANMRAFPPGDFRDVVRPNFDTLYSNAWIDLRDGPMVISVKPGIDRYYLLPVMDMWTDVFTVPGTRTLGAEGADYVLTAPGWRGDLPAGLRQVEAPTPIVWLIGRTQTNSPTDYAHVHAIQDGYRLVPLSAWGHLSVREAPTPVVDTEIDRKTPPARIVAQMPADRFFTYAAQLIAIAPPHAVDGPELDRLARIGFVVGKPFDFDGAPAPVKAGLARAAVDARPGIILGLVQAGSARRGWRYIVGGMGAYGGDYGLRAAIAMGGLGANRPEDAIYPAAFVDADGKPLDGHNGYALHFTKAELPPVDAFWSLTLYDREGYPEPNALNRFALGDRDPPQYNADGSLDLYIGGADPGVGKSANWLPAAPAPFSLSLRLYLPKPQALDGRWSAPPVRRR